MQLVDKPIQEAKKMLLWLTFECTKGGNPRYCPLYTIRLRSFEERRQWLERMEDEQVLKLYSYHRNCCRSEGAPKERGEGPTLDFKNEGER